MVPTALEEAGLELQQPSPCLSLSFVFSSCLSSTLPHCPYSIPEQHCLIAPRQAIPYYCQRIHYGNKLDGGNGVSLLSGWG